MPVKPHSKLECIPFLFLCVCGAVQGRAATMAMAEQQNRAGPEGLSSSNEQEEWSRKNKGFPPPLNPMMSQKKSPRRPSAEEMIQYYSRKGLDKQAATEKVIDDLQKALTIAVSRLPSKNALESQKTVSGTLESLSNRLSAVEAKVDEKPNLGGVFTAGVAAGGFLHAVPHVFRAVSQVSLGVKDVISRSRV